mgnify:CR=1 FL=1|eukprot:scaffold299908_cov33-Tisochrysis_lutea.AAC.1
MPSYNGKSLAEACAQSARAYSHIFNSSQEQRPDLVKVDDMFGRPVGPQTYNVPRPQWLKYDRDGTLRKSPAFLDGQLKMKPHSSSLTAKLDYVDPHVFKAVQKNPPGSNSYQWPSTSRDALPHDRKPLDKFYDPNYGKTASLERQLETTSRTYAASFKSQDKRFNQFVVDSNIAVGPGKYDVKHNCLEVKNPTQKTPTFQSRPWYKVKPLHREQLQQAPDSIPSSTFARESKVWTQSGFAFSTRARFPRVRPTWSA